MPETSYKCQKTIKGFCEIFCLGDEISNQKLKTDNSNDCVDTGNYLICPIPTI